MPVSILCYNQQTGLQVFDDLKKLADIDGDTKIWVDIAEEGEDVLASVAGHFGLHELTVEDALDTTHLPKLEYFGDYLFLILRGLVPTAELPEIYHDEGESEEEEEDRYLRQVAIYFSTRFVITYRSLEISWLDAVVRQAKNSPERTLGSGTDMVAHRIIDVLTDRFVRSMEFFDQEIDKLEEIALESPAEFELFKLLELKRELVHIRQVIRAQREVVQRLCSDFTDIIDSDLRRYFRDISDHTEAILSDIDRLIDGLQGVREAYVAFYNVRLADIMRILAVLTLIAAPLNIIVGLFGMNFEFMPLLHSPNGFLVAVTVLLLITLVLLMYFRKKQWL